jgi:hypothetical protein
LINFFIVSSNHYNRLAGTVWLWEAAAFTRPEISAGVPTVGGVRVGLSGGCGKLRLSE